jgi:hypothetical protein
MGIIPRSFCKLFKVRPLQPKRIKRGIIMTQGFNAKDTAEIMALRIAIEYNNIIKMTEEYILKDQDFLAG